VNTFGSIEDPLQIITLSPKAVVNSLGRILTRGKLSDRRKTHLSSKELSVYIHLPTNVIPGIERIQEPEFQVPPILSGTIPLGEIIFQGTKIYPATISLNDLRLHTVILGQTGFGKSHFVFNLIQQVLKADPEMNWVVFDWKGEYFGLLQNSLIPITVFRPGAPDDTFHLNMFDPQHQSPEEYTQQVFDIITEVFAGLFETQTMELSAQMKRIFRDLLLRVISDPKKQSLPAFLKELTVYRNPSIPNISGTLEALKTRLHRLTVGSLGKIFMFTKNPVNIPALLSSKIIIDLSYLKQNGTINDVRLFMNLLAKQIFNHWVNQGNSDRLKYLMFLEEAQYLLPEILLKKTAIDLTIIESAAHSIRSVGVGLVSIATRPIISQHILANSALKVIFRSSFESDKLRRTLGLSEEQEQYLKSLPIQKAICHHPNWPHPFILQIPDCLLPSLSNRSARSSQYSFKAKQHHMFPIPSPDLQDYPMRNPPETSPAIIPETDWKKLTMAFNREPVLSLDEVQQILNHSSCDVTRKSLEHLEDLGLITKRIIPDWKNPNGLSTIYCDKKYSQDPTKTYTLRVFIALCRTKQLIVDEHPLLFDAIIKETMPVIALTEDELGDPINLIESLTPKLSKAKTLDFEYLIILLPISMREWDMDFDLIEENSLQLLLIPFAQTAYQQIIQALKQENRKLLLPFITTAS
jgi:hypothetical protein